MRKIIALHIPVIIFVFISHNTTVMAAPQDAGEALYKKHCSACHPRASKLKTAEGMVDKMRNPPPFMPGFGEDKIPADDAKKIADYIYQSSR